MKILVDTTVQARPVKRRKLGNNYLRDVVLIFRPWRRPRMSVVRFGFFFLQIVGFLWLIGIKVTELAAAHNKAMQATAYGRA